MRDGKHFERKEPRQERHLKKEKRQVDRNFILAVIQTIIALITLIITAIKN